MTNEEMTKNLTDSILAQYKLNSRINSISATPKQKLADKSDYKSKVDLTASEIVDEAEIIYQYLIKDL